MVDTSGSDDSTEKSQLVIECPYIETMACTPDTPAIYCNHPLTEYRLCENGRGVCTVAMKVDDVTGFPRLNEGPFSGFYRCPLEKAYNSGPGLQGRKSE
jgi:hypothetical protein